MNISIPQPAKIVTIPSGYTFKATDDNAKQTVTVSVNCGPGKLPFTFVLWSGLAYIEAGDWTQAQINAAVAAYLAALPQA